MHVLLSQYIAPRLPPLFRAHSTATFAYFVKKASVRSPMAKNGKSMKSRRLSDLAVKNIREMFATGHWTMPELADRFSCSSGTIWNVIHGKTRGGDGPRRPRAKLACVAERDRKLVKACKKIVKKLPTTFILEVKSSVDVTRRLHSHPKVRNGTWRKVGVRRVQQILRAGGLRKRVCPKTTCAYVSDVEKRLTFGKMIVKILRPLQSKNNLRRAIPYLFGDETWFTTFNAAAQRSCYVPVGSRPPCRVATKNNPGMKVFALVWIAVDYTHIDVFPESGFRMCTEDFIGCLKRQIPVAKKNKLTFYFDNASCHNAKAVRELMEKEGVRRVLDVPPRSPDGNPVEEAINTLKRAVAKELPTAANLERIVKKVAKEFQENPHQRAKINNHVASFYEKWCTIVEKKGMPAKGGLPWKCDRQSDDDL